MLDHLIDMNCTMETTIQGEFRLFDEVDIRLIELALNLGFSPLEEGLRC